VGDVLHSYDHYANGMLRGFKGDAWEGGHRVPFIITWPKTIAAGTTSDQLICHIDMLPSIAQLVKSDLSEKSNLDGVDVLSALLDGEVSVERSLILHSVDGDFAVRNDGWKLIQSKAGSGYSGAYLDKYVPGGFANEYEGQLYRINEDIGESDNLYGEYPEIVRELTDIIDRTVNKEL
jgi:arylsulfatase A-like enzyme